MHNYFLMEKSSMGHVKGISDHEPSLLPTKSMVLSSPQVELRSHVPQENPGAALTGFANGLIMNGLTCPTLPLLSSTPSPGPGGEGRLIFLGHCADPDFDCLAGPGQAHPLAPE